MFSFKLNIYLTKLIINTRSISHHTKKLKQNKMLLLTDSLNNFFKEFILSNRNCNYKCNLIFTFKFPPKHYVYKLSKLIWKSSYHLFLNARIKEKKNQEIRNSFFFSRTSDTLVYSFYQYCSYK